MARPPKPKAGEAARRTRQNASSSKTSIRRRESDKRPQPGGTRKRNRPSASQASQSSAEGSSGRQSKTSGKKRKASEVEDADTTEHAPKRFQHLKARTRRVPQSVIASKWTALPHVAQQQVQELFHAAKRPVALGRPDERRREEAEKVLNTVVRKLEKQLSRMPFPAKTKDAVFSLEKLLERNRLLESQLTPAMHSIELLDAAIEKEERSLERDRRTLARLEANAISEERRQQKQAKKIHPLLKQAPDLEDNLDDYAENINLVSSVAAQKGDLMDDADGDPDLLSVLKQLQNHMESMHANRLQVAGIDNAIVDARASLDDAIYRNAKLRRHRAISGT
ncbi:hypothetical protein K402DRAFT_372468 [Aulographum hederae CBS 113979]|uniref:Kinetochore protein fta7 n=1 Tax=Aulographum hederae CBS 113979 TaxID=1176131 RepID=A0A6G1H738_9PEZI|nr:hypothetical protein K402DRAFT_372468 [Aulographum hederae CBS 113979]